MDDRWMSVDEIAAYRASARTRSTPGRASANAGYKVGRFWKFKKDEVDGWVCAGGAAVAARGVQEAG